MLVHIRESPVSARTICKKESVVIINASSQPKNMASEQKQSIPSSDPDK